MVCSAGRLDIKTPVQNRFWFAACHPANRHEWTTASCVCLSWKHVSINYTLEETETNKTIFVHLLDVEHKGVEEVLRLFRHGLCVVLHPSIRGQYHRRVSTDTGKAHQITQMRKSSNKRCEVMVLEYNITGKK